MEEVEEDIEGAVDEGSEDSLAGSQEANEIDKVSSPSTVSERPWSFLSDQTTENLITKPSVVMPKIKSKFVEDEAEEEEDEFMGMGGVDGEDEDGPDEYEIDGDVVVMNEETDRADVETVRAVFQ